VIPALNEAATLAPVVRRCLEIAEKVVLVDDGSTDGTGDIARKAGAEVVRHETPQGYDAAIADGINHAFQLGAKAAITCDADGQHRPEDVCRVAEAVLNGSADFCAGIRDHYNRPIEAVVGLVSAKMFGTRDPFCGLKCYGRRVHEVCGEFPLDLVIGALPFYWVREKGLRQKTVLIQTQKRVDQPRFGTSVRANWKLGYAFARLAAMAINSSRRL